MKIATAIITFVIIMIIDVLTFTITYYQFKSNKFNMFNRASAIGYRYTYFTRCSGMGTVRKGWCGMGMLRAR